MARFLQTFETYATQDRDAARQARRGTSPALLGLRVAALTAVNNRAQAQESNHE
ncbi:hypothetical protein KAR91_54880 [Candidatus Pacearchaeota archaeon]|nr:hypothetical protein [Candidatus Pacearchaeota archaeon]